MSTGTGPDDDLTPAGGAPNRGEDTATRITRGVVDGFTEASQAFSHEIEGTNRFPELMGRSMAGVIRANARLLDEVATMVRQAADGWGEQSKPVDDLDYERLADLVAARIMAAGSGSASAEAPGAAPPRRKT